MNYGVLLIKKNVCISLQGKGIPGRHDSKNDVPSFTGTCLHAQAWVLSSGYETGKFAMHGTRFD